MTESTNQSSSVAQSAGELVNVEHGTKRQQRPIQRCLSIKMYKALENGKVNEIKFLCCETKTKKKNA